MAYGPRQNTYQTGNVAPATSYQPAAPQMKPPAPQQAAAAQKPPIQFNPAAANQQANAVAAPVQNSYVPQQVQRNQQPAVPLQQQPATGSNLYAMPAPNQYVSQKISKINGKDKVMDFSSKLNVADVGDFANVHGIGGKNHARTSVVCLTLCDYSKKASEGTSETVHFNVEVEDIPLLYNAAVMATMGLLRNDGNSSVSSAANAVNQQALATLRKWVKASDVAQGLKAIPTAEIVHLGEQLKNVSQTVPTQQGKTVWSYAKEKNNPNAKGPDGFVPVSKVSIAYLPIRSDGQVSRYPWAIQVENYEAPLMVQANGSSAHNGKAARNRKSVNMMVSANDFLAALVAVDRYVRLWEQTVAIPVIRSGLRLYNEQVQGGKSNV